MLLSKSDYLLFLKHPAWLWYKKFNKKKLPEDDEGLKALFAQGHKFEEYAEKLFPEGVTVGFERYSGENSYLNMPARTKEVIQSETKTIFQGRLEYDNLTCIFDVLDRVGDGEYDFYEIKASSSVKSEHIYDLAFQAHVIEGLGIKIRKVFVIHVNREYVRDGDIKFEEITSVVEVTSKVNDKKNITKKNIKDAFEVVTSEIPPNISPRFAKSKFNDWLTIYKYLNLDLDKYSIYGLSRLSSTIIGELEDMHIDFIRDIPNDVELSLKQKLQVEAVESDKRIINKSKIQKFIDSFEYPLYFLDYETLCSVIPAFDKLSPYQQYPFQYSLHKIDKKDGQLLHKEFLHLDNTNPGLPLVKQLKKDIGDKGTVIVWNESFEKGINDKLGEIYPEYSEFLKQVNSRVVDLMIPFSKDWYVDKDFFGSASIKAVLPALITELSYKEMDISEGGAAQRIWMETFLDGKNQEKKEKIAKDLIEYCKLDTLAMVRIFEFLEEEISKGQSEQESLPF